MSKPIRVIQCGLGDIGRRAARLVLEKSSLRLAGAVDPRFDGRDLGRVLELDRALGIRVSDKLSAVLATTKADAVLHCTGSTFAGVHGQFAEIIRAGLHCVSSCEEAMFPFYREPKRAAQLNRLCARHGVSVLGTGVNPGFVMDTLATIATAVCRRVDAVRVLRVVDAGTRREALQRKVGAGLSEKEFRKRAKTRQIRHVGLGESLVFIAEALDWDLTKVDETIAPVLSEKTIRTKHLTVTKGQAAGVRQVATGWRDGRKVLELELHMYVGATKPRDEVTVNGIPPMRVVVEGGTPGDEATPAILVNCLPRVMEAKPGLHTMLTIGLPRAIL
ncbi:MAG: dihydrodipicolinate reductase [Verrucomicrobia bacterium]|nr:dihydrodipicolinate reductase [Verrucomicrobiota bacterium]